MQTPGNPPPQRQPTAPPVQQGAMPKPTPHTDNTIENYQTIAETVGLVPSLRMKDNAFQAIFVFTFLLLSVGVGYLIAGIGGLIVGVFIGLIGGIILSGIVLMIMGWVRAAKRLRR